jgi:hypothetical protein
MEDHRSLRRRAAEASTSFSWLPEQFTGTIERRVLLVMSV